MRTPGEHSPDDAVTYAMAAKAIACSRRTIERMVERGTLTRVEGLHPASVTRRSLVTAVEQVRIERNATQTPFDGPAMLMMLEQIRLANDATVEARSELAELRVTVRQIEDKTAGKEALLNTLVNGSRSERRKARKAARLTSPN